MKRIFSASFPALSATLITLMTMSGAFIVTGTAAQAEEMDQKAEVAEGKEGHCDKCHEKKKKKKKAQMSREHAEYEKSGHGKDCECGDECHHES